MAETPNTRVTRLESLMGVLAQKEAGLDDVLVRLKEAQIKTDECFRATEDNSARQTGCSASRTGCSARRTSDSAKRTRTSVRRTSALVIWMSASTTW
jgi:uncharacterized protein YhaN